MAKDLDVVAYHFDELRFWDEVVEVLEDRPNLRLPTAMEAVYIDFEKDAIWVSDMIGNNRCVMDKNWGPRTIIDGCYGLVLVGVDDG